MILLLGWCTNATKQFQNKCKLSLNRAQFLNWQRETSEHECTDLACVRKSDWSA